MTIVERFEELGLSDEMMDRIWDGMSMYCYIKKVHEVCYLCAKPCKTRWTYWSWQIPPEIYCDKYDGI